jgi:hypothetical protein
MQAADLREHSDAIGLAINEALIVLTEPRREIAHDAAEGGGGDDCYIERRVHASAVLLDP